MKLKMSPSVAETLYDEVVQAWGNYGHVITNVMDEITIKSMTRGLDDPHVIGLKVDLAAYRMARSHLAEVIDELDATFERHNGRSK